jgi:Dual specificity phosphatase, catalytic domain
MERGRSETLALLEGLIRVMRYSEILPAGPMGGSLYQGDRPDMGIFRIPGPLALVTANIDDDAAYAHDGKVAPRLLVNAGPNLKIQIYAPIADGPEGVLPIPDLVRVASTINQLHSVGYTVYLHCWSGVSRSSYYSIAAVMTALRIPFDQAFAYVKARHQWADPLPCFVESLKNLSEKMFA